MPQIALEMASVEADDAETAVAMPENVAAAGSEIGLLEPNLRANSQITTLMEPGDNSGIGAASFDEPPTHGEGNWFSGLFEPRLHPGMIWILWQCACGKKIWDDYQIQDSKDLNVIENELKQLFRSPALQASNGLPSSSWLGAFRRTPTGLMQPIRNTCQWFAMLKRRRQNSPDLEEQSEGSEMTPDPRPIAGFLTCVTSITGRSALAQKKSCFVTSDRGYFCMLRDLYGPRATSLRWILSLRTVIDIRYVEVSQVPGNPYMDAYSGRQELTQPV